MIDDSGLIIIYRPNKHKVSGLVGDALLIYLIPPFEQSNAKRDLLSMRKVLVKLSVLVSLWFKSPEPLCKLRIRGLTFIY
jgi:hypothetical protein